MTNFLKFFVCATALIVVASSVAAMEWPLSPESIREAYFLGRQTGQANAFLSRYAKHMSTPSTKELSIGKIQMLTPYAQLVIACLHHMVNENSVDVEEEYQGRALPVLIRVWVYFPSAYNSSPEEINRLEGLVESSRIIVSQKRELQPTKTSYRGLTRPIIHKAGGWVNGLEVKLRFDADDFQSAPVQISITAPNGQHAETTFDLSSLQ